MVGINDNLADQPEDLQAQAQNPGDPAVQPQAVQHQDVHMQDPSPRA